MLYCGHSLCVQVLQTIGARQRQRSTSCTAPVRGSLTLRPAPASTAVCRGRGLRRRSTVPTAGGRAKRSARWVVQYARSRRDVRPPVRRLHLRVRRADALPRTRDAASGRAEQPRTKTCSSAADLVLRTTTAQRHSMTCTGPTTGVSQSARGSGRSMEVLSTRRAPGTVVCCTCSPSVRKRLAASAQMNHGLSARARWRVPLVVQLAPC